MSDKTLNAVRRELREVLKNPALASNDDLIGEFLRTKPKVLREASKALHRMALIKLIHDVADARSQVDAAQFEMFEGVSYPDFVWIRTFDETGKPTGRIRRDPMDLTIKEADQLLADENKPSKRKSKNAGLIKIVLACRPHMADGKVIREAMPLADAAAKVA